MQVQRFAQIKMVKLAFEKPIPCYTAGKVESAVFQPMANFL